MTDFVQRVKILSGVARGFEPHVIRHLWQKTPQTTIYVTENEELASQLRQQLEFCLQDVLILSMPAWDCLPYDRVSPAQDIMSERLNTLMTLLELPNTPTIIVTSVHSIIQRMAPKSQLKGQSLPLSVGHQHPFNDIITYLSHKGYNRTETVREAGEFAVRGDILDIFPIGEDNPVRLDFFGDLIESIRVFDATLQTTLHKTSTIHLKPSSEICLTSETISTFRQKYREQFGPTPTPLYETISQGRRAMGLEHWLPLFFQETQTLLDYLPDALVILDFQTDDVVRTHLELIHDYYNNRKIHVAGDQSPPFNPLSPDQLYMTLQEWEQLKQRPQTFFVTPFSSTHQESFDFECRTGTTLEASPQDQNNIEPLKRFINDKKAQNKGILPKSLLITALSDGSRDRLQSLLQEHGMGPIDDVESWPSLPQKNITLFTYPLERGFETPAFILITEQDLLGQKIIHQPSKKRQVNKILLDMNQLSLGDLLVHQDHGIGRFEGLFPLQIDSALHDCLCLTYDGGDKLYLPVENIEVVTKYGNDNATASLDKLGSAAWQNRKARAKKRIREIADYLIKIAAERAIHKGAIFDLSMSTYHDFCSRFPYMETDDQLRAIDETLQDLTSGLPMDRLICGDVGFGKTEVALRAAFMAVANGTQVAVVAPTTLLCRQHYLNFRDRFSHTGFRVEQLSRFTSATQSEKIRQDMAAGKVDIVIATHTLFSDKSKFSDLGLLIIDEEQHFGVKQKEKLKQLQNDVHVLTLTATPIPRTLQLALTGVREMSIIATPPIDRLAVRTFVMPYDPLVIREAILREHHRGGQIFFVCPRLDDLAELEKALQILVPEIKIITAHGQMPTAQLENVMTAFYDRQYDLLLSTNIVESGIDIASANTLVVYRSDLFGLAQLYQLRGRVGRSKAQSYAYLTVCQKSILSDTAKRRLEIMQTLDKLGAGFTLASHDMDIRGTGNLVGEEQSGHIREVGVELYQHLLQEAIMMARAEQEIGFVADEDWMPQIHLGTSVMIPETYIHDLNLRLNMYRRAASLQNRQEIDAFAAEMIDRFGKLPQEVQNLFEIIEIKSYCRQASIEKVDVGPKGVVITFHNNTFANPQKLMAYVQNPNTAAKIRPDQKIVFLREWSHISQRVHSTKLICRNLAKLAK